MNEFFYQYILIAVTVVVFLAERFFVTISFRKEMYSMRQDFVQLGAEFTKLAVLLQAFLMNINFKDADGKKPGVTSKLKATDTQIMVSAREMEKLREIERLHEQRELTELKEKLRPVNKTNKRKEDTDDDDELFFSEGILK